MDKDLFEITGADRHEATPAPNRKLKKRAGCLTLAARFFLVCLVLVGVLALAAYLSRDWLTTKVLAVVEREASKQGVHVGWRDPRFAFPRGLILKDLTLYRTKEKREPMIRLSDVAAGVNMGEIIAKRKAGGWITMEDSTVTFFRREEGEHPQLTRLHAKLAVDAEKLRINQMRGVFGGLHLDLKGLVHWGKTKKKDGKLEEPDKSAEPGAPPQDLDLDFTFMAGIAESLDFKGDAELSADLRVDSSGGGEPVVEATGLFKGKDFTWRGSPFDAARAALAFRENQIDLPEVVLRMQGGEVKTRGRYDIALSQLMLGTFSSDVNLPAFLRSLPFDLESALAGIDFKTPPHFNGRDILLSFRELADSSALLEMTNEADLTVRSGETDLHISGISAGIKLENGLLDVSNLKLKIFGGDASINLRSRVFQSPLVAAAAMNYRAHGGAVVLQGIFDSGSSQFRMPSFSSNLDILALLRGLPFGLEPSLEGLGFKTPPHLAGKDLILDLADFSRSRVLLATTNKAELDVAVGEDKTVSFTGLSTNLKLENGLLDVTNLRCRVLEGDVGLNLRSPIFKQPFTFAKSLVVRRMSLKAIGDLAGATEEYEGLLDFTFQGGGGLAVESITGKGTAEINEGKFYSIPLFVFLKEITPAFATDVAKKLTAAYSLKGGVATIEEAQINSTTTKIKAKGTLNLLTNVVDADVHANLAGPAGFVTGVVTKMLEIKVEGPVDDPKFRLTHVPEGMTDAAGMIIKVPGAAVKTTGKAVEATGKVLQAPGKAMEKAGDKMGGAGGTAVKATGRLLGVPGKILSAPGKALKGKDKEEAREKPEPAADGGDPAPAESAPAPALEDPAPPAEESAAAPAPPPVPPPPSAPAEEKTKKSGRILKLPKFEKKG